jgi:uncharacterized protein
MKTGSITFTLDTGKCPKWLFCRMKKLGGIVLELIVEEYGIDELIKRLSHPVWFQSLGCALAFDWNSSGLTVTLTAALKEALKERNLGIYICGGKGRTSKKTLFELERLSEILNFDTNNYIKLSKLIAKVDNTLIQDGFNLYHHTFIISKNKTWAVIQQGMNTKLLLARRYHWSYFNINENDITTEPHLGIVSDLKLSKVFNLTDKISQENKMLTLELINQPKSLIKDLNLFLNQNKNIPNLFLNRSDFKYHPVLEEKFDLNRIKNIINQASFLEIKTFEDLLVNTKIGPKTLRAISLVGELVYNKPLSYKDPARYSFSFGGKDGIPYPVDKNVYDEVISLLNKALNISRKKLFLIK